MKLTKLDIQQFGPWQDLHLSLPEQPLQVIYGPNEAGKSTLMRFIRGVLYGFEDVSLEGPQFEQAAEWSGSLSLSHRGQLYTLKRSGPAHEPGSLQVEGLSSGQSLDELMSELTGPTDATLFQNVFAVGLDEVQHLHTLHDEEVAQHVYGLTLGPEGRRILNSSLNTTQQLNQLFDPRQNSGRLTELLREEEKLRTAINTVENKTEHYARKTKQLKQLQTEIRDLKQDQKRLQEQQRGYRFMELVYKPWKQVHDLEVQLGQLPEHRDLPEDGLTQLHRLDAEIQQLRKQRQHEREIYQKLQDTESSLRPPRGLRGQTALVADLVARQDWARNQYQQIDQLQDQLQSADSKLESRLTPFKAAHPQVNWKQVDVNPANTHKLMQTSRAYQKSITRQKRHRTRYDKLHQKNQDREKGLEKVRKESGGLSFNDAVQKARMQFTNVKRRLELQMQKKAFQERLDQTQLQMARLEERIALPPIAYLAIAIFVLGGLLIVSLGLYNAYNTQFYMGAVYFFLGLTAAGLGWAIKSQFRDAHSGTVREAQDNLFEINKKITSIQSEIDSLLSPEERSGKVITKEVDENMIDQAYRRLQELEGHLATEKRCLKERERLSQLRQKSQELQKGVSDTRHDWCQLQRQIGLSESTQIEPTWERWTEILTLHAQWQEVQQLEQQLEHAQKDYDQFLSRVEDIDQRLQSTDSHVSENGIQNLPQLFSRWEHLLEQHQKWKGMRKEHRQEIKQQRAKITEIKRQWEKLRTKRSGLLEQAGVHSILEYQDLDIALRKRVELEKQLKLAREELQEVASIEPDLAIVEEDLVEFKPDQNQDRLAELALEEEQTTEELNKKLEQSGGLKQELTALEQDHGLNRLRFQHAQLQTELKQSVTRWLGTRLAQEATVQIQSRYERTQQPEVLATASSFLDELTRGKYRNVWTPLGKRYLCLDDQEQRTFRVEQVSRGTRELLFLAIRMAITQQFVSQDVHLPFILDDVLVNFDQIRTESTVEFLLKRAEQGQQSMMCTCHQHLAKMLEEKGVETIHLPSRDTSQLENRWAG